MLHFFLSLSGTGVTFYPGLWLLVEIFLPSSGQETDALMFGFPETQVIVPVGSTDEVFCGYIDLGQIHMGARTAGMVVSPTSYGDGVV